MSVWTDHDDTWPMLDGPLALAVAPFAGPPATPPAVHWAARSERGVARSGNEDRWGRRGTHTFAVADGMGGHVGGALAAATAIDRVLAATDTRWEDRVREANLAVRHPNDLGPRAAGTTLVALEVRSHRVTVASVGDSRVYRWRSGRLERLTVDHTLRGALLSAGIDADRHAGHREARSLTSYLGMPPQRLRVDVVDVPLASGDRFLLCTDGVHDAVPETSLAAALRATSCDDALTAIFRAVTDAGAADDATAVLVEVA